MAVLETLEAVFKHRPSFTVFKLVLREHKFGLLVKHENSVATLGYLVHGKMLSGTHQKVKLIFSQTTIYVALRKKTLGFNLKKAKKT